MRPLASVAAAAAALLLAAAFPVPATAGPEEEVEAALQAWAEAYAARDGARSAAAYAPDARLWGTNAREQSVGREAIAGYFASTARGMRSRAVEFGERATRVFGDAAAVSSGRCDFRRVREDGAPADIPGRFSMALARQPDGRWLIVDHHSSPLPAGQ